MPGSLARIAIPPPRARPGSDAGHTSAGDGPALRDVRLLLTTADEAPEGMGLADVWDDASALPPLTSGRRQIPPRLPLWWFLLPYILASGLSLLIVYVWLTPHPEGLRVGVFMGALTMLALAVARQSSATTQVYATFISNEALGLANQQLAAMNKHLHLLATTDPLTGLSNRAILEESIHRTSQGSRPGVPDALLLLDLDRFKEVNDTLGHRFGDLLLKQIGARLLDVLGGEGRIARLGGDEFALILPGADVERATAMAQRCLEALDSHFTIEGHILHVGGSIGVALAPEHGRDISTLLRCADVAMYLAKRRHGGYAIYTPAEDQHSPQRLTLAGELQQAITQGGLCLFYQPTLQLPTGQVLRVEALVRWDHPHYGFISPDQFIPLAEQTGLIVPLTRWVLETALRQCRAWQDAGLSLAVAVNLSMRNLQDVQLPELVDELLQRTGVAPQLLTLEITESMLMADPATTLEILERLDKLGTRIAIDDFGTGHSSLGYLKRLPVDELKIDQAFVLNLAAQRSASASKDRMIVRSVIALAHALGLEVVAEGVESQQTWELLAAFRCNAAQGYYLSRPLAATDLEAWLRAAPCFAIPGAAPATPQISLEHRPLQPVERRDQGAPAFTRTDPLAASSGSRGAVT